MWSIGAIWKRLGSRVPHFYFFFASSFSLYVKESISMFICAAKSQSANRIMQRGIERRFLHKQCYQSRISDISWTIMGLQGEGFLTPSHNHCICQKLKPDLQQGVRLFCYVCSVGVKKQAWSVFVITLEHLQSGLRQDEEERQPHV